MAIKTVIFDLDGTLADTSGDLIAAANACFQALGHGDMLDPTKDQSTALKGGRAMLRLGFDRLQGGHDQIDAQYPHLLSHYGAHIDRFSFLYPGAVEAITALRHGGYKTGICTNKPEGLAEQLMRSLGARDLFDSLVGADTLPVCKPNPEPFELSVTQAGGTRDGAMLVGDTATDRNTAKAAGVPSLLVTFGPDGREVQNLNPEALLESYSDLAARVADLIGTP